MNISYAIVNVQYMYIAIMCTHATIHKSTCKTCTRKTCTCTILTSTMVYKHCKYMYLHLYSIYY